MKNLTLFIFFNDVTFLNTSSLYHVMHAIVPKFSTTNFTKAEHNFDIATRGVCNGNGNVPSQHIRILRNSLCFAKTPAPRRFILRNALPKALCIRSLIYLPASTPDNFYKRLNTDGIVLGRKAGIFFA